MRSAQFYACDKSKAKPKSQGLFLWAGKLDWHWIVMIVIAAILSLLVFGITGCVTPEHQELMDAKIQKLAEHQARLDKVYQGVLDGSLTIIEARTSFENISKDITEVSAQINRFDSGGYNTSEILFSILQSLATIAGTLGITRFWRGGVHNRYGET